MSSTKKLHPYERLVGKAAFQKEIKWMVNEAYKKSDKDMITACRTLSFLFLSNIEVSNFLFTLFQVHEQEKKVQSEQCGNVMGS